MWASLDSQAAIEQLLSGFGGFHDACLREISVATETYVAESLAMHCPPHLDTSVLLFFQRQGRPLSAIEVRCEQVTGLHYTPSAEDCDSIVTSATLSLSDGVVRLAVHLIGGLLRGGPRGGALFNPIRTQPDLEVTARSVSWRPIEAGLGNALRYRRLEA